MDIIELQTMQNIIGIGSLVLLIGGGLFLYLTEPK